MNAKKIMGAVLVALLAAALFVGAGAAAITADVDGSTVFVNQKLPVANYSGNWVGPNGAYTPADVPATTVTEVYFGAAGTYTAKVGEETVSITVKAPALTISGVVGTEYTFIPGNFYQDAGAGKVYVSNPSGLNYTLYYTNTTGTHIQTETNASQVIDIANNAPVGEYTFQAEFNASNFVVGTTPAQLMTVPVTFSVVGADDAVTISAAETTVLKSDSIKLTVTGQPGVVYNVTFETPYAFNISQQIGFKFANIGNGGFNFTMPAGGKATFEVEANTTTKLDKTEKIFAEGANTKKATVTITFEKGTISAKTELASYFVGDSVKIIGTSTAGMPTKFNITGTNFKKVDLDKATHMKQWEQDGNNFEFYIDTTYVSDVTSKKMDVGTYTITLIVSDDVKATVPLTLKQPFISIISAPEVIVQGEDDVEFIINAEAATEIAYYIFGTNYFAYAVETDNVEDEDGDDIENQFVVGLDAEDTKKMAAGQYFAVFQHPMYDKALNITGNQSTWEIKLGKTLLFNVKERQTANAAQALCDALDTQNIDDMYVKYSFFVVGEDESFTISEIPTSVAQGETLTISGVSTANADKTVTVEMISTAFAAVPKETVGSAAFILVTTTVAEDGTWEVTLDTSDLNVDEYSLNVACEGTTWKNVKVNVVEAADEPVDPEQPGDEPEQPGDEPVAPETPGFGALAALAGLGAVAVLLLRRE